MTMNDAGIILRRLPWRGDDGLTRRQRQERADAYDALMARGTDARGANSGRAQLEARRAAKAREVSEAGRRRRPHAVA